MLGRIKALYPRNNRTGGRTQGFVRFVLLSVRECWRHSVDGRHWQDAWNRGRIGPAIEQRTEGQHARSGMDGDPSSAGKVVECAARQRYDRSGLYFGFAP